MRLKIQAALALLLALSMLGCSAAVSQAPAAGDFSGVVVAVLDGDTVDVMRDGRAERIRLNEIDAPEKAQAFGQKAKQFTSQLAFNQTVTVRVATRDRYNRTVGEIILPDGRSLNRELVRAGFAWHYKKYSSDASLAQLEREARAARLGLWADPSPQAPWDFRREEKSR